MVVVIKYLRLKEQPDLQVQAAVLLLPIQAKGDHSQVLLVS